MPTDIKRKYKKAEDVTDSVLLRLAASPYTVAILAVAAIVGIYLIL